MCVLRPSPQSRTVRLVPADRTPDRANIPGLSTEPESVPALDRSGSPF